MADFTVFINRLVADTGLDKSVVTAWVSMEQGVNNNVLGMTDTGLKTKSNPHGLYSYTNQTVAADATANRLKTLPYYKGIMASTGGSPPQQALAITTSPWHSGHSGVVDPYYLKGFVKAGLLTSSVGATLPNPKGTLASSSGGGFVSSIMPALDPNTPLTSQLIEMMIGDLTVTSNSDPIIATTRAYFTKFLGKPIGQVPLPGGFKQGGTLGGGIGIPGLDLTGVLYFLGVVLVGVALLGVGGLITLKGKT